MPETTDRASTRRSLEDDAELLVAYQLDLAQIEAQLRSVHHTMRGIEQLRGPRFRVGPELSNAQSHDTMTALAKQFAVLDAHLQGQHESCRAMQDIVEKMQERLSALRASAGQVVRRGRASDHDQEPTDNGGAAR
jgi:hypothetical protein